MESSLLKSNKPYHKICQAPLKEFFTQIPDKSFLILFREFYLNMRLVGTSLKSFIRGVEIDFHKDKFWRIFELPIEGISYALNKPIGFKNFKHSTSINSLVIDPMEKKKASFKSIHMKPKLRILHYLLTIILFPRIINHRYVVREDVVPVWLLTQ